MLKIRNNLESFIIEQIERDGSMTLGEFISLAMTHPEYGYYTSHDPIGVDGDFTTAPEISQIFGELIGAWIIDIWIQLGKPEFNLIECGPGRGTLMADITRIGAKVPNFSKKVHIGLVETQGLLREKQKESLSQYKVTWHEDISEIKKDKPCIILGNEFLDALPIEQLKRDEHGWRQRTVNVDKQSGALKFDMQAADDGLVSLLSERTESNQVYEVSSARIRFIGHCYEILGSVGGAALFIDYGHNKSHFGDTIQAVRKHSFSNVLENIGQSDITSHVDFDALCRNIKSENLKKMPIIAQRRFLLSLGIEQRAGQLKKQNTNRENDIEQDVNRLISNDQMGNLFKVMCFYKGNLKPCGFD